MTQIQNPNEPPNSLLDTIAHIGAISDYPPTSRHSVTEDQAARDTLAGGLRFVSGVAHMFDQCDLIAAVVENHTVHKGPHEQ